jgi:hypothetical protein
LYAFGCALWAAYIIRSLASFHLANRDAPLSGAFYCVLLVVAFPSVLGYLLLFKAAPRAGRFLRR